MAEVGMDFGSAPLPLGVGVVALAHRLDALARTRYGQTRTKGCGCKSPAASSGIRLSTRVLVEGRDRRSGRARLRRPARAREYLDRFAPAPAMPLRASGALGWTANIEAEDEAEHANLEAVFRHMDELVRVPTVVAGTVMPDACPSDHRLGAIPVGGVAATRDAIHPGMHSADICCSMAVTIFDSGSDAGRISTRE